MLPDQASSIDKKPLRMTHTRISQIKLLSFAAIPAPFKII